MAITQRGNVYRVQVGKRISGKYTVLFSQTVDTYEDAAVIEAKAKRQLKQGDLGCYKATSQITLGDLLLRYKNEVVPEITQYPKREYSKIDALMRRKMAKVKVVRLKSSHFADYRDERRQEKGRGRDRISRKTIKEELSLMRRILEYAKSNWEIVLPDDGNPINVEMLLKTIRNDRKKRKPLPRNSKGKSFEFERKLIKACENYGDGELALFVRLAIETACRRSALIDLRWEKINVEQRFATVRKKGQEAETYNVPLSRRAIATLKRLGIKKRGKVFSWTHPDSVNNAIKRACKRAGLQHTTPHQFRHEGTTRAQAKGLTAAQTKAVTGHSTTQMLDNYGHLDAVDVVDFLDKKGGKIRLENNKSIDVDDIILLLNQLKKN